MPQPAPTPSQLLLTDERGLGRISVDVQAFFEFSFWMAEELEDLVAKWSRSAAPVASKGHAPRG